MNTSTIAGLVGGAKAALGTGTPTGTPTDTPKEIPITNDIRRGWNNYTDWLDKKGLKGSPELDKNDLGLQMIDQYRTENPATPITRDMVIPIQKEFQNYRNYSLDQVKQGKASFAPNTNEGNFMKSLSIIDGIPGQRTTSFKFPEAYLQQFDAKKGTSTIDKGFAVASK